jgi:putative transposase
MIKSYKIRLLPNQEQEQLLWKHVNMSRFIWNWGLGYQLELFKNGEKYLSGYSLRKVLTQLKQKEEYSWLSEISSHTLSNIILDLDEAHKRFFKKSSGKPKFKKKNKTEPKFPVRQDNFYLINNCANIEKIGKIKYQTDFDLPQGRECKFTNPRIKYVNNKWILSFGMECENQACKLADNSMGIDLGIKDLAVVSNGKDKIVFKNINKTKKVKKLKSKLKHLQKNISRKYDFNNKHNIFDNKWFKSKSILKTESLAKDIYYKLSNIRKNYTHQTTSKLVNKLPKRIIMENLNIRGMMKNKHLSKAITEQNWYEFIRQIKYKSEWKGIEFVQVGKFFPSSKTCSGCGYINKNLKLSNRIYNCSCCGLQIDRDYNAAINLMNYSNV